MPGGSFRPFGTDGAFWRLTEMPHIFSLSKVGFGADGGGESSSLRSTTSGASFLTLIGFGAGGRVGAGGVEGAAATAGGGAGGRPGPTGRGPLGAPRGPGYLIPLMLLGAPGLAGILGLTPLAGIIPEPLILTPPLPLMGGLTILAPPGAAVTPGLGTPCLMGLPGP